MPNSAHVHLILNHFPVIGTGIVVFILIYGVFSNNEKIKKIGLMMTVLISLITIPVFISGDNAKGIVKGMEGIVEENIDPHEDFAKNSFIAMEIVGGIALVSLLLSRRSKPIPIWNAIIVLLLLVAVNAMMIYTAHLGGKITHSEIIGKQKQLKFDDD